MIDTIVRKERIQSVDFLGHGGNYIAPLFSVA